MKIKRGTVAVVSLDPTLGHEQRGVRPCVIVSDPGVTASQKYPMLCVVPITSTVGEGALYPNLQPGASGLRTRSYALVDQMRSLDKRRLQQIYGVLSTSELNSIEEGIRIYLGL